MANAGDTLILGSVVVMVCFALSWAKKKIAYIRLNVQ